MQSTRRQREQTRKESVAADVQRVRVNSATVLHPRVPMNNAQSPAVRLGHAFPLSHNDLPFALQAKPMENEPGDQHEQKADHTANQTIVMPGTTLRLQRKCGCTGGSSSCGSCEDYGNSSLRLQRLVTPANTPSVAAAPVLVHDVLHSPGQALDQNTRSFFEQRFGQDLSNVRIHNDDRAGKSARAVNAAAYTVGSNIVFERGQYAPGTSAGRKLLAHELTHTIQQQAGAHSSTAAALEVSQPSDAGEREAETTAEAVTEGGRFTITAGTGLLLSRQVGDERDQVERRQSEIELMISQMISALSAIREVGAEVEFTFWASQGAITLVGYRRTQPGTRVGRVFDSDQFAAAERRFLPTFVGTGERYIQFTMIRTQDSWVQRLFGTVTPPGAPARPPEGRNVPISSRGYSVDTFSRADFIEAQIRRLLNVPRNATAELIATIELDDDRILNWSPDRYQATEGQPRGQVAPADPDFGFDIKIILLPFTRGLGRRTVRMVLRGRHSGGATNSTWHVAEAGVVRPVAPGGNEADDIVREYRHRHEEIIVQWRRGVRDAAVYVGMLGAREIAFWMLGGVVFRVFGAGIRVVAPTLYGLIGPGTRVAAEYLETLIVRLLPAERAEFSALAARAETEGLEALSVAERSRLNALLARLEQLVSAPITDAEKGYLRTAMHGRYGAVRAAEVAAFDAAGRAYQVHHRLPLEYGHLFPGFDVNAGSNLIGLDVTVHRGVNAVWTRFRTLPSNRITPAAVNRVTEIVDRYFAQWYHSVPPAQDLGAAVEVAKDAARADVDALIEVLSP